MEPISRDRYMVKLLYEEVMESPHKFNETETKFIKDLQTKFFNDPDYKLSEKQLKWVSDIWAR